MLRLNTTKYPSMTDAELIQRYNSSGDNRVATILVNRYQSFVFGRLSSTMPFHEAEEYAQEIWRRLFCGSLENYREEGRFDHYLSKIVKQEAKQYWRKARKNPVVASLHEFDIEDSLWIKLKEAGPEELRMKDELLQFLVTDVIPGLPPIKRMVWLLRNEAEFADANLSMNWETLAQLNGLSVETTWEKFESARTQLLHRYRSPTAPDIDTEALVIFLVWTHSQRPVHHGNYTLKEISEWVGVPESTLKDRYYDAEKRVAKALAEFANEESAQ